MCTGSSDQSEDVQREESREFLRQCLHHEGRLGDQGERVQSEVAAGAGTNRQERSALVRKKMSVHAYAVPNPAS